jgi:sigma-B regulation protein RsbU (phosphoserine phosphatase)
MRVAQKIQTALLPKNPSIANYEIAAFMQPAAEVGGDYYDVIEVAGRHWVIIGDVSGHGVPAGLVMMMAQTAIRTALLQHPDAPPSTLLEVINRVLYENIRHLHEDKYMTLTVLAHGRNGTFHFAGAHQDIIVYRAQHQAVEQIETPGVWLGIVDDVRQMNQDSTLTLAQDDVMVLYTDGATEAFDAKAGGLRGGAEMYGVERLSKVVLEAGAETAVEIVDRIVASLADYQCPDDVTLLALKRVA